MINDEFKTAIKIFHLLLFNLRFQTISRIEFERRTIIKTRFDSSNKILCSILKFNQIKLFNMFEIQFCGQSNHEIVVRFDFLFDYDAQQTRISVNDKFNKIHFLRHFR